MTGPEHYREAERLLTEGRAVVRRIGLETTDHRRDDLGKKAMGIWAQAQAHATLALAAATAYPTIREYCGDEPPTWGASRDWSAVIS